MMLNWFYKQIKDICIRRREGGRGAERKSCSSILVDIKYTNETSSILNKSIINYSYIDDIVLLKIRDILENYGFIIQKVSLETASTDQNRLTIWMSLLTYRMA